MYRYVGFLAAIFENRAWRWSLQLDLLYIYINSLILFSHFFTVKTPGVSNCRSLIVRVCSLPKRAQNNDSNLEEHTDRPIRLDKTRLPTLLDLHHRKTLQNSLQPPPPFPPFYRHRSPKKFTNTDEPPTLSSPPHQFPISSPDCEQAVRAQWGPCHGSACPRTKDNCDLEQTWGWGESGVKAKVKSSFSSSALRFTYNTTGTKSCSYLRMKKKEGEVIIRFTVEVGVEGGGWLPGNKEWK